MFHQIAILLFVVKLISANDPVCTQGAQPGVVIYNKSHWKNLEINLKNEKHF